MLLSEISLYLCWAAQSSFLVCPAGLGIPFPHPFLPRRTL